MYIRCLSLPLTIYIPSISLYSIEMHSLHFPLLVCLIQCNSFSNVTESSCCQNISTVPACNRTNHHQQHVYMLLPYCVFESLLWLYYLLMHLSNSETTTSWYVLNLEYFIQSIEAFEVLNQKKLFLNARSSTVNLNNCYIKYFCAKLRAA